MPDLTRYQHRVWKDPDAELPYGFDWTQWLAEMTGETVASAVWTVPAGLTLVSQAETPTETSVVLSGGVAGTKYNVTVAMTTSGGYTEQRTIVVSCVHR